VGKLAYNKLGLQLVQLVLAASSDRQLLVFAVLGEILAGDRSGVSENGKDEI
jgi:hypothetical protein